MTERGCDAISETTGNQQVNNPFIQEYLDATGQNHQQAAKDNDEGAVHRCPDFLTDVEMYDSENEEQPAESVQTEDGTVNFDPRQEGFAFPDNNKSTAAIAKENANEFLAGDYKYMTPFLEDIYDAVKNSPNKDATLKEIQDGMNAIFAQQEEVHEVEFEMEPDGRVDVRYGTDRFFLQRFIDLENHKFYRD